MSESVGGSGTKVVSLQAFRERLEASRRSLTTPSPQHETSPHSLHKVMARLNEITHIDSQPRVDLWSPISALGGDFRTRFVTSADDELAMGRVPQATERYYAGRDDFADRVHETHLILSQFSSDVVDSPIEKSLFTRLAYFKDGLYSDAPEVSRAAIAVSCDILAALSYRAGDESFMDAAGEVKEAAIAYITPAHEAEDCKTVGEALARMVAAVPALKGVRADLAIEQALGHNPLLRSAKAFVRPQVARVQPFRLGR